MSSIINDNKSSVSYYTGVDGVSAFALITVAIRALI